MRLCSAPGCPTLYPKDQGSRCPTHRRAHAKQRGSRQDRGYTAEHTRLRAQWTPRVEAGKTTCAKCHRPINPGTPWDLGHTDDRTTWTGPEHATCNRSAAGVKAHR